MYTCIYTNTYTHRHTHILTHIHPHTLLSTLWTWELFPISPFSLRLWVTWQSYSLKEFSVRSTARQTHSYLVDSSLSSLLLFHIQLFCCCHSSPLPLLFRPSRGGSYPEAAASQRPDRKPHSVVGLGEASLMSPHKLWLVHQASTSGKLVSGSFLILQLSLLDFHFFGPIPPQTE